MDALGNGCSANQPRVIKLAAMDVSQNGCIKNRNQSSWQRWVLLESDRLAGIAKLAVMEAP